MAIEIASNFNPGVREPLDARSVVATYNEMLNLKTTFDGLEVWVTSEQKKYRYNLSKGEWQETYDASTIMTIIDGIVPKGIIMLWSGSADSIPDGWHLCDGTEGTVDLRNRFVVGAGDSYNVGDKGGDESVTLTTEQMPNHSHNASVSGGGHTHSATSSETPDHTHTGTITGGDHSHKIDGEKIAKSGSSSIIGVLNNIDDVSKGDYSYSTETASHTHNLTINPAGKHSHTITVKSDNSAHSHNVSIFSVGGGEAHENRPPYYALCYIQKIVGESGVITPDLLAQKIAECLAHAKGYTDEQIEIVTSDITALQNLSHTQNTDTALATDAVVVSDDAVTVKDSLVLKATKLAVGIGTKTDGSYQSTFGRFNVEDSEGKNVVVVGNGTSDTARSNALAVSWDGKVTAASDFTAGTHTLSAKADKSYFNELTESEAAAMDWTTASDGLYFTFEE